MKYYILSVTYKHPSLNPRNKEQERELYCSCDIEPTEQRIIACFNKYYGYNGNQLKKHSLKEIIETDYLAQKPHNQLVID